MAVSPASRTSTVISGAADAESKSYMARADALGPEAMAMASSGAAWTKSSNRRRPEGRERYSADSRRARAGLCSPAVRTSSSAASIVSGRRRRAPRSQDSRKVRFATRLRAESSWRRCRDEEEEPTNPDFPTGRRGRCEISRGPIRTEAPAPGKARRPLRSRRRRNGPDAASLSRTSCTYAASSAREELRSGAPANSTCLRPSSDHIVSRKSQAVQC